MPLPDAPDYSQRIYELLKETDLENLSYAQFQAVAEKIFIEPENEDEMRRLVLVQLARMAVRGDWDGFLSGSTGTIGGSITNNQVAVGATAANTIEGSANLTFDGSIVSLVNQLDIGGVGAAGIVKNSNTNQDLELRVTGTGNVRVKNDTTNTDSQLNVQGNGTGTPKVSLSNDTKAVTLQCDTNQKITVKGGSDSFIFDVSSSSGGITFPDSTVQTTAASGGSNYVIDSLVIETPSTESVPLLEDLTNQGGTGYGNRSLTVSSFTDSSGSFMYYRSFNASKTGTLSAIMHQAINSTAGASVKVAIYNSDSDGNPQTLIGQASLAMTSFAVSIQTSITPESTGSMDLTKGDLYWIGIGNDGGASGATATGYFSYETNILGLNVQGGAVGTGTFAGYTVLVGAFTPPTTFALLATAQKGAMALGGLYS
jgi:hypothetical protein